MFRYQIFLLQILLSSLGCFSNGVTYLYFQLEIRNEFLLNGDKAEVSLNATSITVLTKKKSFGFYKLK